MIAEHCLISDCKITVFSDKIDFTKPHPSWNYYRRVGTVTRIGNTSLDVKVEIYIEQMYSNQVEKAISELYFVHLMKTKPTNSHSR
jgi:acyl-CoA hydrolase